MQHDGQRTFTASYTPEDIGEYTVTVLLDGQHAPGSPFTVTAGVTGNSSKVKILGMCYIIMHAKGCASRDPTCVCVCFLVSVYKISNQKIVLHQS